MGLVKAAGQKHDLSGREGGDNLSTMVTRYVLYCAVLLCGSPYHIMICAIYVRSHIVTVPVLILDHPVSRLGPQSPY